MTRYYDREIYWASFDSMTPQDRALIRDDAELDAARKQRDALEAYAEALARRVAQIERERELQNGMHD